MLNNTDMRPSAYDTIKSAYRPGHADFTYEKKYGIRDYRGSGRASGRETAARVVQEPWRGSFWNVGVSPSWRIRPRSEVSDASNLTPMLSNGMQFVRVIRATVRMIERIERLAEEGTAAGIVECRISGIAAGLGNPYSTSLTLS